jgi:DNA-binding transcriptional regulator YbjK
MDKEKRALDGVLKLMATPGKAILDHAVELCARFEEESGTEALNDVMKRWKAQHDHNDDFVQALKTRLSQRLTKRQIDRMYAAVHKKDG